MPDLKPQSGPADVNLTNCDREPIHILGRIQDFGYLVGVSSDWIVTHASENCHVFFGVDQNALIGHRLVDLLPEGTIHHIRTRMQLLAGQDDVVRVFSYPALGSGTLFDISVHWNGRQTILEFEPQQSEADPSVDAAIVPALIKRVQRGDSLERMAQEAARGLKSLSGYDRVMVYRFEDDGTGSVIAECLEPWQTPYLGLRYPASDIPKQARALYLKSVLRIIADVDAQTIAIQPEMDPNGQPIDLSLAVTRAVSPIHLEYLKNMGVQASMSVSIIRNGELWGLFACHHGSAKYLGYELRSAIELFAQLFNYELAQFELNAELKNEDRARALHDGLMSQLSSGTSTFEAFDAFVSQLGSIIPFDGAAIYSDGIFKAVGSAPTLEEFLGLARFLNTTPAGQIYATEEIAARYPAAEQFADRVAGLLAIPISRTPRDYLVLFRREIAQSVVWAGNPEKPVEAGPNGQRLTPRKSFEAWQQVVHGTCAHWKTGERRAADAFRVTLLEVVLKLTDESNLARKRAQDQQELLIAELNHRVRNILNLIRGLVSQGKQDAGSLDAYQSVLDARIHALARAHDQLTETEWDWVSFRGLLQTEVSAFLGGNADRVHLSGDEIDLTPAAFTTLALVVHELVTNSVKYGALSDTNGTVLLEVDLTADGTASLSWREKNGPPVAAPTRRGFGSTIIERSIPFELNGKAEVRYRMYGLEADFQLPAKHIRKGSNGEPTRHGDLPKTEPAQLLSGRALVLEDNMIIALDAVDMLTELGAENVQTASRVSDGLDALSTGKIAFALVDVNLGDELSLPVVERCVEAGVFCILATGYGSSNDVIGQYPDVPIVRKPYTVEHLRAALSDWPNQKGSA
ncbi:HWE histidine kinase domain-containing protein [Roseibium sp. MB-4]